MLLSLLHTFRPVARDARTPVIELREWRRGLEPASRRLALPGRLRLGREPGAVQAVAFTTPPELLVRCVEGSAWITCEHDVDDHVLEPGKERRFPAGSRLVVQGRRGSTVELRLAAAS
jgi:hypothetical protein